MLLREVSGLCTAKLLEACLEVIQTGAVVGMQDMGAAGIICSTAEMSAKGEVGMRIDLDKVPTRQQNMKTWELLLSESQERMLMVVEKGKEQGRKERDIEIVKKMIYKNKDINEIMEFTNLSKEEILSLSDINKW